MTSRQPGPQSPPTVGGVACITKRDTNWGGCFYVSKFVLAWALGVAVFPLLCIGVALPILIVDSMHSSVYASLISVGVVGMGVWVWLYVSSQVRLRAGAGGLGYVPRLATSPATKQDLERVCNHIFEMTGGLPRVVGGGWSNVLQRRSAVGNLVYTHRMKGLVDKAVPTKWLPGTPIADVQRYLGNLQPPQVLVNVPSYSYVSIGAWVATLGHGWPGGQFTHSLPAVKARVLDCKTGIITSANPALLRDYFGKGEQRARQFVVLYVDLNESETLVQDQRVQRQLKYVRSLMDVAWIRGKDSVMAALLVGRSETLALKWQRVNLQSTDSAKWLTNVRISLFATTGAFGPPNETRIEKVSSGVALLSLYLYPLYVAMWLLIGLTNFEFYTNVKLSDEDLHTLTKSLQSVHRVHGGRCEIRFLSTTTFFDFFAWNAQGMRAMMSALVRVGITEAALHPGKFQVAVADAACVGLNLVTAKAMLAAD